ncbi:hypothetical protein Dimus_001168 [Dionaea muscipula]
MVMKENQTLEREKKDLHTELDEEKEGRKKADEEVVTLSSRVGGLRNKKMELEASLELKTRENEKTKTGLDEGRLTLTQMDGLEDEWISRVESLKWKLEDLKKDRSTMVPLALVKDSSSSSSDDHTGEDIIASIAQNEEILPTFVKNLMTNLVEYVPPPPSNDLTSRMVEVIPPIPSDSHTTASPIVRDDIVGYRSESWESEAESDFMYDDDWDDYFN